MKPSSAEEYRKRLEERRRARKLVSLPSGAVFEIRKVGLLTFSRIFRGKKTLLDDIAKSQSDEVKLLKLLRSAEVGQMFVEAVTSPILGLGNGGNDELPVAEIDEMDLIVLFNEIILFNDLDKYTADRTRFFREKSTGVGGGALSGEISSTA